MNGWIRCCDRMPGQVILRTCFFCGTPSVIKKSYGRVGACAPCVRHFRKFSSGYDVFAPGRGYSAALDVAALATSDASPSPKLT